MRKCDNADMRYFFLLLLYEIEEPYEENCCGIEKPRQSAGG